MTLTTRVLQPPPAQPGAAGSVTTQTWLPLQDIHDGCLFRPDGGVVAGVAVHAPALSLKSPAEQRQLIQGLQAALDGLDCPWQIWTVPRPIDLDQYLRDLDRAVESAPVGPRRRVAADYLRWVADLARQGLAVERRSYLLMVRHGPEAVAAHRQATRALQDAVGHVRGFTVEPLDDAAWRHALFLVFHADRAAVEPPPEGRRATPLYRPPTTTGGES